MDWGGDSVLQSVAGAILEMSHHELLVSPFRRATPIPLPAARHSITLLLYSL